MAAIAKEEETIKGNLVNVKCQGLTGGIYSIKGKDGGKGHKCDTY